MKPIAPMEAIEAAQLPEGEGWQFEPKWDGFRCLAVREGDRVDLWSKSGKPLARYFPDIAEMIAQIPADRFIIDGELMIVADGVVSFEALQLRLHPAASRVAKLVAATPAMLVAFDCLRAEGKSLTNEPIDRRRAALDEIVAAADRSQLRLSPATTDRNAALRWLGRSGAALDGVIAKRIDQSYCAGERAMVKVKPRRSADCVVGGFRYATKGHVVGSLLLGLYDEQGLLHHVGFTSGLNAANRAAWNDRLEPLVASPGFTGQAPGGPSRWSTERSTQWQPLRPEIVVEVLYDQVTDRRFRHGTRLLRERPDKAPAQCTFEQLRPPLTPAKLKALLG